MCEFLLTFATVFFPGLVYSCTNNSFTSARVYVPKVEEISVAFKVQYI